MSKETDFIITSLDASSIEHAVTDINTAGVHAKHSNHYATDCTPATPANALDTHDGKIGRAVDFAHGRGDGKQDTPQLLSIYQFFLNNYAQTGDLAELFYAGPDADHCVLAGKFMKWSDVAEPTRSDIRDQHHNHVHVAVKRDVFLKPPSFMGMIEEDDMPKPDTKVDACKAPNGVWTLTYDGGVRATGNAKFYGSYPGLPPSAKQGKRNFIAIEADADGLGYTIFSDDDSGSSYHFDAQVLEQIQSRANRNA